MYVLGFRFHLAKNCFAIKHFAIGVVNFFKHKKCHDIIMACITKQKAHIMSLPVYLFLNRTPGNEIMRIADVVFHILYLNMFGVV